MAISFPRSALFTNAALAVGCLAIGGVAGWYWQGRHIAADPAANLSANQRAAMEQVVHDYLLAHPEVLPKAMDQLQQQQTSSQLASLRGELEKPAPGVVLGNPQGRLTLVEFTDYACGYCRKSVQDVEELIAANPDLRVVVRELPILTPASADAAKMALAAAAQGHYAAFHRAMFATGRPDAASIASAASAAGVNTQAAARVIADPATAHELSRNLDLARAMGFEGTPSWVIGDTVLTGAVGKDRLAEAIAAARS